MAHKLAKLAGMAREAQDYRKDNAEKFQGIKTYIKKLDAIFKHGIQFPFYGIIVAAQKAGKTALMLTLMLAFIQQGYAVLFITLEMTLWQMLVRILSNASVTDMDVLDGMEDTEEDWLRIDRAIEMMKDTHGYFAYGARTPEEIAAEIKDVKDQLKEEAAEKGDPTIAEKKIIVIIDYAQLMNDPRYKTEYEMQTHIAHWLRAISQGVSSKLGRNITVEQLLGIGQSSVSVLTALQIAKSEKRAKAKVTSASARGTGAWEEDADAIFAVNDQLDKEGNPLPHLRHVDISGRFTGGGDCILHIERAQARFQDPTEEEEELDAVPIF